MLFWFEIFSSASRFQRFQTRGPSPITCPQLPAENSTTEHAEHTEMRAFFFRVFRVFRG